MEIISSLRGFMGGLAIFFLTAGLFFWALTKFDDWKDGRKAKKDEEKKK